MYFLIFILCIALQLLPDIVQLTHHFLALLLPSSYLPYVSLRSYHPNQQDNAS